MKAREVCRLVPLGVCTGWVSRRKWLSLLVHRRRDSYFWYVRVGHFVPLLTGAACERGGQGALFFFVTFDLPFKF